MSRIASLEHCLLAVARLEIGRGETTGNNRGVDVVKYRRGVDDGGSWCAAFVSYCYEGAALMVGRPLPRPLMRHHGAKRLGGLVEAAGRRLSVPEPGSVIWWDRGDPGSWQGHIGIVSHYDPATDTVHVIEGNKGSFPALVKEIPYPNGKWRRRLEGIATTAPLPQLREVG